MQFRMQGGPCFLGVPKGVHTFDDSLYAVAAFDQLR